jgi:hypothetical protein
MSSSVMVVSLGKDVQEDRYVEQNCSCHDEVIEVATRQLQYPARQFYGTDFKSFVTQFV